MEPKEERVDKKIIPTDHVDITLFAENDIEVDVLRLDLIDPVISGNKWFKLKNYLAIARNKKLKTILTFGGPYSNHIVATACAAFKRGIHSIGMIRGEQPLHWSHTLKTAAEFGMVFNFLSRSEYKTLSQEQSGPEMTKRYPEACIIPEGGAGKPGIEGSADILKYCESRLYNEIICAVGTGTMFAGLANGSALRQFIRGISVLKGTQDLGVPMEMGIRNKEKINFCTVHHDYHFGGYAKKSHDLIRFMNDWYELTGIPTDFVYTAKLFYAVTDLVKKKQFPPGSKLLIIHSGGLQGNGSLAPGTLIF